jgi:hypothetical protein
MKKATLNWLKSSDYDLKTAAFLLKSKRYIYVVFMCHFSNTIHLHRKLCNQGNHTINTGGHFDPHVLQPIITRPLAVRGKRGNKVAAAFDPTGICCADPEIEFGIMSLEYHWTTAGGCKDYRSIEIEKKAIRRLIKMYPGMIREIRRKGNDISVRLDFN